MEIMLVSAECAAGGYTRAVGSAVLTLGMTSGTGDLVQHRKQPA